MITRKIGNHATITSIGNKSTLLPNHTFKRACVKVTYHDTIVIEFDDNQIILNTGGYKTTTTKRRMNQASKQFSLGIEVFQRKREWYVTQGNLVKQFIGDRVLLHR